MPFEVKVHTDERILEVVYPAAPSSTDVQEYAREVRGLIDGLGAGGGEWMALVDQSQLRQLSAEAVGVMTALNAYAQLRGMKRSARIVADPGAGNRAWRMTRQAMLTIPTRTFETREAALAWLREPEA